MTWMTALAACAPRRARANGTPDRPRGGCRPNLHGASPPGMASEDASQGAGFARPGAERVPDRLSAPGTRAGLPLWVIGLVLAVAAGPARAVHLEEGLRVHTGGGAVFVASQALVLARASNPTDPAGRAPELRPALPLTRLEADGDTIRLVPDSAVPGDRNPPARRDLRRLDESIPLPEPATVLVLLGGLSALSVRSMRRRSRRLALGTGAASLLRS